jgi:primosomal protein N' (replication factor Y)
MAEQQTLFGVADEPRDAPARHEGLVAAVALEDALDKLLDYAVPPKLVARIAVGQRVRVPLGRRNRPSQGYVIAVKDGSDHPRVKPLLDIEDERVLVTPGLLDLSRWMSRYYCAPLGTVLDSVIPAAVKKKIGMGYLQMVRPNRPREDLQAILEKTKAPKRRAILARLLQLEPDQSIELIRLARESGATAPTVRKLAALGLITVRSEPDVNWLDDFVALGAAADPAAPPIPDLNEDQQKVFDDILPRLAGGQFSVNLLFGVTGSGKTEIYLRCIEQIVATNRQAIVLVPEIALTPQTVRRFTARFPRVAVLHSGLTASQRHRFWQQCASGQADVVVGARSAVFAPVPRLGMIVVDEEHEASYKQDQAPRYNGRDVAIKRAQIEGAPVILGSATPSLETYHRVQRQDVRNPQGADAAVPPPPSPKAATDAPSPSDPPAVGEGRGEGSSLQHSQFSIQTSPPSPYHLLTLPRRVRGLSMPHVELIDLKVEAALRARGGGIHVISHRLEHLIRTIVDKGQQAILLLNRRGYSNFVFCVSCQEPVKCRYCDTTMTYHRSTAATQAPGTPPSDQPGHRGRTMVALGASHEKALHTGQLHCHYCLAVSPLPERCPTCQKKLSLFGLGTQRVEEELARKFPDVTFARVDSDSMHSAKDYEALLGRFAKGEIQVMLGTQMIAKGLDYPNVTLVGVISGDTSLSLPDFRAAERTFQLITQVAGRAGRGDNPGRVVLQTFMPEDPTIQSALRQDFAGFAQRELQTRRDVGLPPFGRLVRIVLRDQDQDTLHKKSEDLGAKVLEAVATVEASVLSPPSAQDSALRTLILPKGPMPCAINRIAGYYRNQILLSSPRADLLQKVLTLLREAGHLATSDRIAVDVDPVSLL